MELETRARGDGATQAIARLWIGAVEIVVHDVPIEVVRGRPSMDPGIQRTVERRVALALVVNRVRTPEAFRYVRDVAELAADEVAEVVDASEDEVAAWERGEADVPERAWLALGNLVSLGGLTGLSVLDGPSPATIEFAFVAPGRG